MPEHDLMTLEAKLDDSLDWLAMRRIPSNSGISPSRRK